MFKAYSVICSEWKTLQVEAWNYTSTEAFEASWDTGVLDVAYETGQELWDYPLEVRLERIKALTLAERGAFILGENDSYNRANNC
jgi:hypothetical protein